MLLEEINPSTEVHQKEIEVTDESVEETSPETKEEPEEKV